MHELEVHQEELRQQQHELLASRQALEQARDRYANLFELAPIAYVVTDPHGVVQEANQCALAMLDLPRERLLGSTLTRHVPPADRDVLMRHLASCRRGLPHVESECGFQRPDGQVRQVQLTSAPAGSMEGREVFHTAIIDLTERRRSEAERARALEEQRRLLQEEQIARAASAAKDRFIAMLSHELRTPLAPILFALDSAMSRDSVPPPLADTLEMIRRNVLLETRLIDDLLDMTRIVQGKMSVVAEVIDLHDVVNDVIVLCQEQIQRAAVQVAVDLVATAHRVRADPVRLRQVVWNLLNNALRNTPAGGHISICTANRRPEWITLSLRDTGRGIEPVMLSRIFTFFEQDPEARRRGVGLGLGLPISKAIVESHGGRIHADSAGPGTGATFVVELQTAVAEPAELPPPRTLDAGRGALSILLVEDNADSAHAIAEFLRLHGYQVKVAGDIRQAVASFAPGDVLISDIGLPDGSGHDLLRQLRREQRVEAIALSGYGTPDDVERSAAVGFARHIVKPVNPSELLAAIRELAPH